ncbi:MAG: dethiobiotin synthase [Gammaproteobacteria bacterium]|nr:MAG: dethiobiotin synthase [Gammaproteobacteria bacterium]
MANSSGYFITGTDTGVGKTVVTLGLMQCLQNRGHHVAGMKPVASGCEDTADGLRNDDALRLQAQASIALDYAEVNPYPFAPPIAPHLAAAAAGSRIDLEAIHAGVRQLAGRVDRVCVEAIGGWLVPLNGRETVADLAVRLGLGIILVVGIRLGCLNHALLTVHAIEAAGLELAGWVANILPPEPMCAEDSINYLKTIIYAPLLGVVPVLSDVGPMAVAKCLSMQPLENS